MQVNETKQFLRSKKKIINALASKKLEEAIELLKNDYKHQSLHFKKITCKRDKYRHSARVPGTDYRILMSLYDETLDLICVCTHDKYDRINKDC